MTTVATITTQEVTRRLLLAGVQLSIDSNGHLQLWPRSLIPDALRGDLLAHREELTREARYLARKVPVWVAAATQRGLQADYEEPDHCPHHAGYPLLMLEARIAGLDEWNWCRRGRHLVHDTQLIDRGGTSK